MSIANKKLVVVIILATVLVFGGVFAYQYFSLKNNNQSQVLNEEQNKTDETKINETANLALSEIEEWKTYTNTEYGFEIKYPENAELKIIDDYDFKNGCVSIIYNEGSVTFKGDLDKSYNSIGCASLTGRGVDNVRLEKEILIVGEKEYIFDGDTNKNRDYLWINTKLSEKLWLNYSIGFETISGKAQGIDTKKILKQILSTFKFTK